ncbi:MAG: glycosyltransferase [Gemmatimonadetes bacterium]|nr:glycosyltransferase [Gemmatimonadota bacterium]
MTERRALLFSYHFPPSSAAGAQRWDVFTRVGVERGWTFDVVTAADARSDAADRAIRVHHVPHRRHWINARVDAVMSRRAARASAVAVTPTAPSQASAGPPAVPAAIGEQTLRREEITFPTSLADVRRNVRAGLLHLSWLPWLEDASTAGLALAARHRYDAVISSGPPHLSAEAARRAAAHGGAPLVVDFRDPWSLIDVVPQEVASWTYYRLAQRYEQRVLRATRLAVMNTERAAAAMQARYATADVVTVPNGFNGDAPIARHDPSRFVAIFAGNIYLDRDPRPMLAAFGRVAQALQLGADALVLRFIGAELSYGGRSVTALAAEAGLPDGLVEARAAMPRRALFEEMASAAMLVNLPQGARLCVPSKVYEYLHFPAWVLGLEPSDSATYDVLSAIGADVADPHDVTAIAARVEARVRAYRAGARPTPLAAPDQHAAPTEARRFFDALEHRLRP